MPWCVSTRLLSKRERKKPKRRCFALQYYVLFGPCKGFDLHESLLGDQPLAQKALLPALPSAHCCPYSLTGAHTQALGRLSQAPQCQQESDKRTRRVYKHYALAAQQEQREKTDGRALGRNGERPVQPPPALCQNAEAGVFTGTQGDQQGVQVIALDVVCDSHAALCIERRGTRQRATTELREGGAARRGGRKCVENHWGRAWKLDLERCFLALLE